MSRNVGRAGGASAGVIAVVFGVLQLLEKTPPPLAVIVLGIVAIIGVIADYALEQRSDRSGSTKLNQRQESGDGSNNFLTGGDMTGNTINANTPKPKE